MMKKLPKDLVFADRSLWSDRGAVDFLYNQAPYCLTTGDYVSPDTDLYDIFVKNTCKYLIFANLYNNKLFVVDYYDEKKWAIYEVKRRP